MLRAPIAIVPALLAASLLAAGCSSTPEDKTATHRPPRTSLHSHLLLPAPRSRPASPRNVPSAPAHGATRRIPNPAPAYSLKPPRTAPVARDSPTPHPAHSPAAPARPSQKKRRARTVRSEPAGGVELASRPRPGPSRNRGRTISIRTSWSHAQGAQWRPRTRNMPHDCQLAHPLPSGNLIQSALSARSENPSPIFRLIGPSTPDFSRFS